MVSLFRSGMAHPPRSNPSLRSSSGPPSPCITPSTETFMLSVSFMVAVPFSLVWSCPRPAGRWRSRLGQVCGQTVQHFGPALPSAVGVRARGNALVPHGDPRRASEFLERHGHQALERPVRAKPIVRGQDHVALGVREGHGEHEPLGHDYLPEHAPTPEIAALGGSHAVEKDAALAEIHGAERRSEPFRTPPALQSLRLRPRPEDQLSRCGKDARHRETRPPRVGVISVRHRPPFAALSGSPPGGRNFPPKNGGSSRPSRRPLLRAPPPAGKASTAPPARARPNPPAPAP